MKTGLQLLLYRELRCCFSTSFSITVTVVHTAVVQYLAHDRTVVLMSIVNQYISTVQYNCINSSSTVIQNTRGGTEIILDVKNAQKMSRAPGILFHRKMNV